MLEEYIPHLRAVPVAYDQVVALLQQGYQRIASALYVGKLLLIAPLLAGKQHRVPAESYHRKFSHN